LFLDCFEHLVNQAPLVTRLLSACPRLKVLVTSVRELNLKEEHVYVVAPLGIPDPDNLPDLPSLRKLPAVALFIQRAQEVRPSFRLTRSNAADIAKICARLQGVPLAILLTAARVRLQWPSELLDDLHLENMVTRGMPTVPALRFGALLKRERRRAGLTQAQLIERAGYSVSYISMLERSVRLPLAATVDLLAEALQLEEPERVALHAAYRRATATAIEMGPSAAEVTGPEAGALDEEPRS